MQLKKRCQNACLTPLDCCVYLSVIALATGSLLWMTEKTLLTNSSTFRIFSRCFSLCWVTFSTHSRRKLFLWKVFNKVKFMSSFQMQIWLYIRRTGSQTKAQGFKLSHDVLMDTYPSLKTSASFRKAELMRMGKGYFWKSLGKRTTASHCSPSLQDLRPWVGDTKAELVSSSRITSLLLKAGH